MNPESQSSSWSIESSSIEPDSESLLRVGTRFQLANGYMGYRGTLDEFRSEQFVANTIAGLYDQVGDAWREPVNAPNAAYTQVIANGIQLHTLNPLGVIIKHHQSLSLSDAVFKRETVFDAKGVDVTITSRRFLSLAQPHLLCVEFSISANNACEVQVTTGIDLDIWDLNGPHLLEFEKTSAPNSLTVSGKTHAQAKRLVVSECISTSSTPHLSEKSGDDALLGRTLRLHLQPGVPYSFHKFAAITKSGDFPESELKTKAIEIAERAREEGFDRCLNQHNEVWSKRWESANVTIQGDSEADLALRYSIFQLLMVAPVPGSGNSIPARALSGQVYKGAIFWDTEFFMFPFYLHTLPEIAEDLLRYRIHTLPGAKRKAQTEGTGFSGAFYAWESQETGDDACTYFNVGDPFTGRDLRTHFRDKQIHISGDIALAFRDHFEHTGSDHLLHEGGAEVILECARFYLSWIYYKPDKQRYEVLDVIGPDEYHERVNNNAFTNCIVHATFETALSVVGHFKVADPDFLEALLDKLGIREELDLFEKIQKQLYLPQSDNNTGLIEQFDAYFKLEDASLEQVRSRKKLPNEYLGAGQGVAAHTQIIKQADVVMMLHRFRSKFPTEVKVANWNYYEPRTEHGSSLSACAYAMVATDCGWVDRAYPYFLKTARVDLDANYKMYAGTTFIGGSHPAANGGSWMAVVFGFAGLDASSGSIHINPRLPEHWTQLSFRIQHRMECFDLTISNRSVTIIPVSGGKHPTEFLVNGKTVSITGSPNTLLL